MRDFFQNNLALLNEKIPEIGSLLKSNFSENKYRIFPSKSGIPALSIIHPDGTNRTLHSQYDPIQEATRFIETCLASETSNYIIIGLGLGYHLHELIKIVSNNARIIVIEKNPSLARLAFTYNDFSSVINHPGISFHIGVDPGDLENILNDDRTNLAIYGYTPINFKPLVDSEEAYYKNINNELVKVHQNFQIDINTQAAFSKKFYKNIFKNGQSIINSPGIKAFENIFRGIPAILVSAGPSLDKNVNLIKSVRKNIVIISVATALKPLINNGVIPDFVVAIDPNENTLQSFNIETIPKNLWLIYDPCVPSTVISLFKGRSVSVGSKVSLAAWLMKHNNNAETLGNIFSVSHSAFHISCLIGCNPIILVGQDLSFDGHRMHCSDSFYNQMNQDMISSGRTLKLLEYNKYREYSPALVPALNIFDKFSNTTKAMDTYRYQFINEKHKNLKILNATEGGVNIPGTKNMALREALHSHCQESKGSNKNIHMNRFKPPGSNKILSESIKKQKDKFISISNKIERIKVEFAMLNDASFNDKNFVLAMEVIYKDLLEDTPTLLLMQGYNFLGFIEWNLRNRKIIDNEGKKSEDDILKQKLIRDREFIKILEETSDFLYRGFENWTKLRV